MENIEKLLTYNTRVNFEFAHADMNWKNNSNYLI